ISSDYKTLKGGNCYNNFDTSSDMYADTPDDPEVARDNVMQYAGRIGGGDVKYVFDNDVEDANSNVIAELKKMLTEYTPDLLKIGE
ncbi:MAG: pectate lyase, partial [Clostridia bacterium]|nr:pectate lyase [Clostridia bacterium]